jgi:ATP-dependent helicase/nuclease subunit A
VVVTPGRNAADRAQRQALDPTASVWVSASAGTGKTKVLTERLLTLMLDGTDPARILCLTFTRAAAAEMANRLNKRLAQWTVMESGRLRQELVQLTGRNPGEDDFKAARRLFSRVLDTPGGAKIETIHAFCQSLLRRFPLEAGVPPEFAVIEERSAAEALSDAVAGIIADTHAGARPDLADALEVVARYTIDDGFDKLMTELARQRGKLAEALRDGEQALAARLAGAAGLAPGATAESLTAQFLAGGDLPNLRLACAALAEGSASDGARGSTIAAWCADETGRAALLDRYLPVFLTREGGIQKRLFTQGAAKNAACDLRRVMTVEAERAKAFCEARDNLVIIEATRALVRLGQALVEAYDTRKRLHAQLDYDDLVLTALALLRRDGIAPWVLFKLDGGLDHILIDEAQDTNPEQWEIVALLAEEFFAGEDPLGRLRTVFAVGDGKQSIYSFQRADPRAFVEMRRHFEQRVSEAERAWRTVPLEISFRAAEPLLRAVDAVFALPQAADGVALDGTAIRHVAARIGQAGLVELWPGAPPAPDEPDDPLADDAPARAAAKAHARLAKAVAATIGGWLKNGEVLASRDRPVKAGDIMVLVRRRNEFVEALLGELKQRGVPVAGVDRLTLLAQLAVKDLVALGQFLLLPADDLTLAAVLKGPLFGISEEQLFDLAYDRAGLSLWSRLRRRAGGDPLLCRALQTLDELLSRADFAPPYELYADILGARGGRRAMLERLGPEADDPVDEFLALSLTYEREHVPSLQGFLHWLVAGDIEVKRDLAGQQRDEVRIMTVHGAKGLEAPIVFMPDTMQLPPQRPGVLWTETDGLPLWRPHADFTTDHHTTQRQALRGRELQEYRRLLYVALTRAQDRLYICGWQTKIAANAETWYTLCQAGLSGVAEPFEFDTAPLIGEADGWSGQGQRLAVPQTGVPTRDSPPATLAAAGSLPGWLDRPAPAEPDPPKPLLPSRPSGSEPATLSPLAAGGRDRFKRGLLVHRLLQTLPELAAADREAAAHRFLALPVHALDTDERNDICRETLAVLETPEFAALWGPDAQAEVPVVGLIGGRALSGQIDRIVVTDDRVLIVDYKTVRPPPRSENEVADVYLRQLASYRAALERIYPGRAVECAILWTEAPRLMPISPDLLARHLP